MSQENVELVRQAMEALLRRDRDAWFAIHDEDYELVPIRDWPETGVRGREPAWNLNMRILDPFEWAPIEVERVDAGADKVWVHPRYEARGASSGAEVELDYWLVATVRQGRILRTQWFVDRDEALEATGAAGVDRSAPRDSFARNPAAALEITRKRHRSQAAAACPTRCCVSSNSTVHGGLGAIRGASAWPVCSCRRSRMDLHLRDRVYLVTGGSRGLGFAAAEALVGEGARVVVSSRRETSAAAAAARLANGAATADSIAWIAADNADATTPKRLITTAEDRFGRLDGALVSVGGTPPGTVAATPDDAWRGSFESVFLGAVRLARLLGTYLTGSANGPGGGAPAGTGGSVGFVLASSVRVPLAELAVSNGLFPGLAGVVKMLAEDLGPSGIRMNGILPVRIATERVRQLDALSGDPDDVRARKSEDIPLRRYGEPEEFGRVAACLLSPAASYINGAMIPVDGGSIRAI
jgi:3-oxoacyl-[acyl-carrier protein] reductase